MLKYDLHTHTNLSKCSDLRPEVSLRTAKRRGLNGMAVTDHESILGGLRIKKLNKDKNFEVIVGTEIPSDMGDVLCYYVKKDIKSRKFFEVVDEVKKQNGLVVIPHPFRTSTNPHHTFKLSLKQVKNKIDAVECLNARMLFDRDNRKADEIATKLKIAKTAGGDAHFKFEIGTAYTLFDGDLRTALKKRTTKIAGSTLVGPIGGLISFLRNRIL
ncbi:PHP domain-containing protein [Candidatus Woesearchaeota archaeon]|nr:PHP domain-containing protein [Candidatus Woesearchaeota archaeon]